jgi:hypothetical protein
VRTVRVRKSSTYFSPISRRRNEAFACKKKPSASSLNGKGIRTLGLYLYSGSSTMEEVGGSCMDLHIIMLQ